MRDHGLLIYPSGRDCFRQRRRQLSGRLFRIVLAACGGLWRGTRQQSIATAVTWPHMMQPRPVWEGRAVGQASPPLSDRAGASRDPREPSPAALRVIAAHCGPLRQQLAAQACGLRGRPPGHGLTSDQKPPTGHRPVRGAFQPHRHAAGLTCYLSCMIELNTAQKSPHFTSSYT